MPRPPKAKTAAKDSNGNFAWAWHSARHLAPKGIAVGNCRAAFKFNPARVA